MFTDQRKVRAKPGPSKRLLRHVDEVRSLQQGPVLLKQLTSSLHPVLNEVHWLVLI